MLSRSIVALLLILGQQAPAPPGFKSGINLVEVDVLVLDERGLPVRGLQQQDFEVFEDDKPVPIVTFDAVDLPQASAEAAIPVRDRSGTSVASNDQPEDGRVLLIVMDDHHVRFGGSQMVKAKAIARHLVEGLGPSDQAAVVATSGRSTMQAEFTTDKGRLIDAIDRFFPQAAGTPTGAEVGGSIQRGAAAGGRFGFEQEIKARWAMEALSNAAKVLALIPHRRKAILLVSEGLPVSVEEAIANRNASGAWQSLRDFILTAQRSNVAVYPVDPCGLGVECSPSAQQNLRALAENTSGFAVVNTNAPELEVGRILSESGTYYLLGYSSPARPDDGRRHRIKVRTRRPDVQIRARESYVARRQPARATPAGQPDDILISAPIQSRGLTVRVAAVPVPSASSPGAAIVLGMELPARAAIEAAAIDFTVAAIDPSSGRVRARQRFTTTFGSGGSSATGWARLRLSLAVAPGHYLVRIAAIGANRTQGSVFTEVTVPKFEGAVALGGLSIASPAIRMASVGLKDAANAPAISPLATRDIPPGIPLAAEVAVRTNTRALSSPLAITATLRTPDDSIIQLPTTEREASAFAAPAGDIYRVDLPHDLAPGSYRVVVEAVSGRTRVTRELAFRVIAADEPLTLTR